MTKYNYSYKKGEDSYHFAVMCNDDGYLQQLLVTCLFSNCNCNLHLSSCNLISLSYGWLTNYDIYVMKLLHIYRFYSYRLLNFPFYFGCWNNSIAIQLQSIYIDCIYKVQYYISAYCYYTTTSLCLVSSLFHQYQ